MELSDLLKPFEPSELSWRIGSKSRDGKRGLALAYVDARDVMARLDKVVGPENWQDEYTFAGEVIVCRLGIRIAEEWVWKTDGAGKTQIEAEKGGISDAFKRAAVKWGIGRHLYAIESPWVQIEDYGKTKRITKDAMAWLRAGNFEAPPVPQGKDKSAKPAAKPPAEKPAAPSATGEDPKINERNLKRLHAAANERVKALGLTSEDGVTGRDIIDDIKKLANYDSIKEMPVRAMERAISYIEGWEPGRTDGKA